MFTVSRFSSAPVLLVLCAWWCALSTPTSARGATECDRETVRETVRDALRLATPDDPDAVVNCDLTVPRGRVITKRLVVQGEGGSGVTIDCQGARIDGSGVPALSEENARQDMVLIRSREAEGTWSTPTDVTVKNCDIIGAVRVLAVAYWKGATDIQHSSYEPGHARRMRIIAPTRITFDGLTITGRARTPVFFGAGVTYSKLINSELNGKAESVAVYLEAESSRNLIKSNYIHTVTPREVLAVDASNYNKIIDNRFSALNHGGIYLYRNCGEHGIVRHTTPSYNTIVNNVFYYNKYNPTPYSVRPAVYMGSRNGHKSYCDADDELTIGSGASNLDFARNNVVMQNQIYKLGVNLMIKHGRSTDAPNFVNYNTTVTTPIVRLAGCRVPNGFSKDFIVHGETIDTYRRADGTAYRGPSRRCDDGVLR